MIYVLFAMFAVLGVIFGWIAFFRTGNLREEIRQLRQQLEQLQAPATAPPEHNTRDIITTSDRPQPSPEHESPVQATAPQHDNPAPAGIPASTEEDIGPPSPPDWLKHIRDNWMVWLGGTCIGLAGIFLARYSMEQGYLGPVARVTGGIILGLALHGVAEWLRRKHGPHLALAGLAAGGSITLFAALLAAMHLYQLMNVWIVFSGLAIVALVTMVLAVWHGPVLASIGILGAYLVPVLIGGESGNALSASFYALIISASALFLMRFVYRTWLWYGMLGGAVFWWLITYQEPGMEIMSSIYLFCQAYLMLCIPSGDFLLLKKHAVKGGDSLIDRFLTPEQVREYPLPFSLAAIIIVQFFSIADSGFDPFAIVKYSPLCVLILLAGSRRGYLRLHPWTLLLFTLSGWLLSQLELGIIVPMSPSLMTDFYWYCLVTVLIFSVISVFNFHFLAASALSISLAALTPILFIGLSYVLTTEMERSAQWGLLAIVLSSFYFVLTRLSWSRKGGEKTMVWLLIAGHFAYSLAVAMLLRQASMTLALSAQVISLAWVIKQFQLREISWLLKGVIALVVFRLTLNPWLVQYPTDIHWSLWTYGGATVFCLAGALQLKGRKDMEQWVWVAVIHLFALTLWAETRYWLYEGNVYAREYSFREAVINMGLFGMLGLVYHLRAMTSEVLTPVYRFYSGLLILFSLFNDAIILTATLLSFPWVTANIGTTPVFNFILLAYGLPVVLGCLYYRFYDSGYKQQAALFTAISAFIFVSLEVRHLWQGNISLVASALDGELYTYSALWLAIAVACILAGIGRFGQRCYQGGMLLLALVIAKLFIVDMSGLEGLLRVASFMGMGLGLLGIAYLHQRLISNNPPVS